MTGQTQKQPNYRALMLDALDKIDALETRLKKVQQPFNEPIAIVGMGCRFPGAEAGLSAFQELLENAGDAITQMPAWRWQVEDYFDSDPERSGKMYVQEGGFIENLDQFDAGFFDISPREAMAMDPQQRLWLEVCWEALEQANIIPGDLFGTQTGVFVGASSFDFAAIMAKKLPVDKIDGYLGTGASLNILAGRLSYCLGLTGPSMALDTACSSSLVAVHNACQSLRQGECDLALAGGVNVILAPETYVAFSRAGMLSPQARCKTFAENADGFIRSEGCGAIILKRLSDVKKNEDSIWAIIKGSAVNQDGASGGLTIPSGPSQQAVINAALLAARVKPEQVDLIEAHGTGTVLGDPIEMRALAAIYGNQRDQEPMYVASVKTNLGHLEAAAGIASLIKTALSLHQAKIYPHLHFTQPSSHIDWRSWPVKIPVECQQWPASGKPRTAAVSSFGLSGTNAHLIMQQSPDTERAKPISRVNTGINLLLLSAKSFPALQQLAAVYANQVFSNEHAYLADICFSANRCRSRFSHRLALVANSGTEFIHQLKLFAELSTEQDAISSGSYHVVTRTRKQVGLLLTGQGSQWQGMAAQMYGYYPEFTRQVDHCQNILQQFSAIDLKSLLLNESSTVDINATSNAQPALFVFEYAWVKQCMAWGIQPACMLGHSLGEYVAACIADVFTLEQGLQLIVSRAQLMQDAPGNGAMAAVFASAQQVQTMLSGFPGLSIAAYNSVENQVVSGREAELKKLLKYAGEQGFEYTQLVTSHGFHSPCMDAVSERFLESLSTVQFNPASVPIIANLTAMSETECFSQADYWVQHLRQPVQFQQSVETLEQQGLDLLIEMGPKPVLTGLVHQNTSNLRVESLCSGSNRIQTINQALVKIVLSGLELNWQALNAGQLTNLPTYPWQKQLCWPDWFNEPAPTLTERKSLWGNWLSSSVFSGNTEVFEFSLDVKTRPWLIQHQVYGLTIAPLALMISIIYEALFKRDGHMDFVIDVLEITKALLIPEQDVITLQLILTRDHSGYSLQILSRAVNSANWQQHVSGHLHKADSEHRLPHTLMSPNKNAVSVSGHQYYHLFSLHGLQYGRNFQGIEQLWQQGNDVLAELNLPIVTERMAAPHPVLLDLAMQLMAAIFNHNSDDLSLPVEIQRIQCWRHDFADSHWISGGLNSVDQVDLFIYNRKHQLQFSITGVKVATVSEHRFKQMLMPVRDWYYQSTWRPHRIISNEKPRSWLLIYAKPDETIAKQLSDQGHHVRMWHYKQGMDIDLSGVDEIVDLTALTVLADPQRAMSFCEHLLSLLKRMTGLSPRLTLVTRHAQGEFTQHLNYSGAALWGIAAVLFQEHAELSPRIIDLSSDQNLLTALLDNSGEQRLVVTEQEIFGQRLQRYQNNSAIRIKIDSQASYLITGGLGALGWVTARWLVAQGARHLYITTRQKNPQLPAGLKTLQDQYPELELTVCSTEIAHASAIEQLFDEIEQSGIPLKGIIHSAGYSDDDLLINQSAKRLEQLNQVKLIAAVMLDKASRKMPLDFFLLYSSLNVLLGNLGQGAYAAANAAMDALAWQRSHDGLPALSINWGPWQIGMQQNSQAGMQEHWQQSGLNLIDESHADLILDQLIKSKDTQVCIADLDWQTIARNNAFGDRSGLLQELIPVTNNEISGANPEALLHQLSTADPGQLKTLLTDWVGQQLTQILKLPRHQLAFENPLSSLGLDSLAAVELRAQMRKTLQLEVPVSQLLQSDGIGLIQYLEQQLSSTQQVEAIDVSQQEMLEGEL